MPAIQNLPAELVILIAYHLLLLGIVRAVEHAEQRALSGSRACQSSAIRLSARSATDNFPRSEGLRCRSCETIQGNVERKCAGPGGCTSQPCFVSSVQSHSHMTSVAPSAYGAATECLKLREVCSWLNELILNDKRLWAYIQGDFSALSEHLPYLYEYLVPDAMCPCDSLRTIQTLSRVKFVSIRVHECQTACTPQYTVRPRPFPYEQLSFDNLSRLVLRERARAIQPTIGKLSVVLCKFRNLETAILANCLMLPYGPSLRALEYSAPTDCQLSYRHLRFVAKRSSGLQDLRLVVSRILEANRLYFQIQRLEKSRVQMPQLLNLSISADMSSIRAVVCGFAAPKTAILHLVTLKNMRAPLKEVDMARLASILRWPERVTDIFAAKLVEPKFSWSVSIENQLARQLGNPPHESSIYAAVGLHVESPLVRLTFAKDIAAALASPDAVDCERPARAASFPRRTIGTMDYNQTIQNHVEHETAYSPVSCNLSWMSSVMRDLYAPHREHSLSLVLYAGSFLPNTPADWAKLLVPFDACQTLVIPQADQPSERSARCCGFDHLVALAQYLGNGDDNAHDQDDPLVFVNERIRQVHISCTYLGSEPQEKLLLLEALSTRVDWYPPPSAQVKWSIR